MSVKNAKLGQLPSDQKLSNASNSVLVPLTTPRVSVLSHVGTTQDDGFELVCPTANSDRGDQKSSKEKKPESVQPWIQRALFKAASKMPRAVKGRGASGAAPIIRVKLHQWTPAAVNSTNVRYIQFINGLTSYTMPSIAASTEFSSFNTIWDEFFLHSVLFHYQPNNIHSSNTSASSSAAGSPGDVNTCGATMYGLQHNQANYTDTQNVAQLAMDSGEAQWVNLGLPFEFTWRNVERYDPKGPVGDSTSAGTTQQWLNIGNSAQLGGRVGLATPYPSGAAAGLGTLTNSGAFGIFMTSWDVSFRVRS